MPALQQVEALRPLLPEAGDDDAAAAEHHRVLALEVSPHASAFLHPEGLLGGASAGDAADLRRRVGLAERADLDADHAASLLQVLAWLQGAEADAIADGQSDIEGRLQVVRGELVGRHLLAWWPPFLVSLEDADGGLYAAAARLAGQLLASLADPPESGLPPLPPAPPILDDARTGLAHIARRLSTPALAGGLLPSHRVRELGRAHGVPSGFGKRWQVLENLVAGSVRHGCRDAVLADLDALFGGWQERYRELGELGLGMWSARWHERAGQSRALVQRARVESAAVE